MAEPISVKPKAAPVVMSESTKIVLVAAFAYAASQFIRSEIAMAAIIPAAGILVTWVWGLWHRLRTWGALRHLADLVPDEVAVIGKRK
jgi:hypothetical protein